jgi:hypothetical protein
MLSISAGPIPRPVLQVFSAISTCEQRQSVSSRGACEHCLEIVGLNSTHTGYVER